MKHAANTRMPTKHIITTRTRMPGLRTSANITNGIWIKTSKAATSNANAE